MKANPRLRPFVKQNNRAVALIIVLAILLLMSGLLVAFMGTVSNEREASRSMTAGFEAKQAYETAVNLAISQIREATKNDDGSVGWASQPGAIQTFGSGKNANMVYKLYTATLMQQPAAQWQPGTTAESGFDPDPAKLATTLPGFVDINSPLFMPAPGAKNGEVEPHYPIVDPRAALDANGAAVATPGTGIVTGFFAANIPHATLKETRGGNTVPVLLAPMRVRWLYQLKDGSVVAPDASDILKGASKDNPPVARLAFWADDESAKINVNTAGEGTYWDVPLASSINESGKMDNAGQVDNSGAKTNALSISQPMHNEYQRYPGHPATTCLSPALRWLFPAADPKDYMDSVFKEAIYRLAPRMGGGYATSMETSRNDAGIDYKTMKALYSNIDRDRLFATLDEYWFRPDRSPISAQGFYPVFITDSPTYKTDPKFLDPAKFTPSALEKLRFFLTAVSRAPDLNLYGMPRVCIWPVHEKDEPVSSSSKRSGFDDLMVFCSTIATKPYIFSRANPWSPTYDYEISGAQTYSGPSLNINANRNRDLVEKYLMRLANMPVPATPNGDRFTASGKYGTVAPGGYTEMDQIFLEIFDYIRCTNMVDTGRTDNPNQGFPLAYTLGYSPNNDLTGNTKPNPGSGQVSPTVHYDQTGKPTIKGFGRYVTLSELALVFYEDTSSLPTETGVVESAPPGNTTDYLSFRCAIVPEFFTVSAGYAGLSEAYAYKIRETTPFTVTGSDPNQAPFGPFTLSIAEDRTGGGNINYVGVDAWRSDSGRFFMPTRGISNQFVYDAGISLPGQASDPARKIFSKPNSNNAGIEAEYSKYPFYSKRIDMPKKAGVAPTEFKLSKGTFTIDIYPLDVPASALGSPPIYAKANLNQPIQTLTITFPEVTLPAPKQQQPIKKPLQLRGPATMKAEAAGGLRGTNTPTHPLLDPGETALYDSDVIRSMEINGIAKGDNRHVAGLANPPDTYYQPSGDSLDYFDKTKRWVHNLHSSWGADLPEAKKYYGRITKNADIRFKGSLEKMPDVPKTINGAPSVDGTAAGDADRGISKQTDGPFINQPNEGNARNDPADDFAGGGGLAYFRGDNGTEVVGDTYFSPNRVLSSPLAFGSLPTGIISKRPWETLLFSPPTSAGHKGAVSPADHYLLDLFSMPVIEPFPITEPLSTMGRINLNARLAPFGYAKVKDQKGKQRSYIERNTGLFAVLKGIKQLIVSNTTKESGHAEKPLTGSTNNVEFRFDIDPALTIENAITPRFDVGGNGFFKCASEICEVDLLINSKDALGNPTVFNDPSVEALRAAWAADPKLTTRALFWQANSMTGDNAREKTYSLIYPRLTTKSNVYTVHVWSQSLLKNPNSTGTDWQKFDETRDRITGEYRGSTTIERYLDANDAALVPAGGGAPYDAVDAKAKGLDPYYRFRILSSKRFTMQ